MSASAYIDAQFVRAQIERIVALYPEMRDDAQLFADTLEGETKLHELATRLIRMSREAQSYAAAIKDEEAALAARRSRYERRHDSARSILFALLDTAGLTKLELPIGTAALSAGRRTCVITDEAALPARFMKIVETPRRDEITKALLDGENVPGAALRNGSPTLVVRV